MLKGIIDRRGLKQRAVAARAGYNQPHLSKILDKPDVSTDELERIARAIDLKPGDLMENSCGDLRKVLPLVDVLREFDDAAIPHVMAVLEAMRSVAHKQNIYGGPESVGSEIALPSTTPSESNSREDVIRVVGERPTQGPDETSRAAKRRRHADKAPRKAK